MHSDAALTLGSGIEKGALDVDVGGVTSCHTVRVFLDDVVLFYLVDYDSVNVYCWTKY